MEFHTTVSHHRRGYPRRDRGLHAGRCPAQEGGVPMIRLQHRRRLRLHRRRAAAPAAGPPASGGGAGHLALATWANTSTRCTPTCASRPASSSATPSKSSPCDVLFLALPHGAGAAQDRAIRRAGAQDRRPLGRFPPARPGGLPALVRAAARCARLAGQVRLRPARAAPRGAAQRQLCQRGGLQRHRHQPGAAAAGARPGCSMSGSR